MTVGRVGQRAVRHGSALTRQQRSDPPNRVRTAWMQSVRSDEHLVIAEPCDRRAAERHGQGNPAATPGSAKAPMPCASSSVSGADSAICTAIGSRSAQPIAPPRGRAARSPCMARGATRRSAPGRWQTSPARPPGPAAPPGSPRTDPGAARTPPDRRSPSRRLRQRPDDRPRIPGIGDRGHPRGIARPPIRRAPPRETCSAERVRLELAHPADPGREVGLRRVSAVEAGQLQMRVGVDQAGKENAVGKLLGQ